jgi:hypothetical protein
LLPLIFVPGLVPLSAWVRSNRQRDRTVKRRASLIAVGALLIATAAANYAWTYNTRSDREWGRWLSIPGRHPAANLVRPGILFRDQHVFYSCSIGLPVEGSRASGVVRSTKGLPRANLAFMESQRERERLLILVPAWNEELGVGSVVKEVFATLPDADVLVIDDGSIDRTAEVAAGAGARVLY